MLSWLVAPRIAPAIAGESNLPGVCFPSQALVSPSLAHVHGVIYPPSRACVWRAYSVPQRIFTVEGSIPVRCAAPSKELELSLGDFLLVSLVGEIVILLALRRLQGPH